MRSWRFKEKIKVSALKELTLYYEAQWVLRQVNTKSIQNNTK